MKAKEFDRLVEILGYSFEDQSLLQRALTHRSVGEPHNETLEFLGDSVLSAIVSSHLYQNLPDSVTESELTIQRIKIVNNHQALFQVAESIAFQDHIVVDKSFVKSNRKAWKNLLANTLEALIGAVYLDGGISAATEFFNRHFSPLLNGLNDTAHTNFKSLLQEHLQSQSQRTPRYETIQIQGKDHQPFFTVRCHVDTLTQPIIGKGQTVKEAEQVAASQAYELLYRQNR